MIDGSDSEIHKIYYAECTYSNIDNTLRTCSLKLTDGKVRRQRADRHPDGGSWRKEAHKPTDEGPDRLKSVGHKQRLKTRSNTI